MGDREAGFESHDHDRCIAPLREGVLQEVRDLPGSVLDA
jgi:hypothetical protein